MSPPASVKCACLCVVGEERGCQNKEEGALKCRYLQTNVVQQDDVEKGRKTLCAAVLMSNKLSPKSPTSVRILQKRQKYIDSVL